MNATKAALSSNGYAFPFRAFSPDEAAELLAQYEHASLLCRTHSLLGPLYSVQKPHLLWRWADRIAHCPAVLDVVEEILGPHLLIWSMDVFRRPRADDTPDGRPPRVDDIASLGLEWHQDSLYLGIEPVEDVVRVWLALTPTTTANGAMRYLRGSHGDGALPHHISGQMVTDDRGPAVCRDIPVDDIVPVVLPAGAFSVHDIRTVHDSGVNTTNRDRVAVSTTYISGAARPTGRCGAMLARGRMPEAFDPEPRPDGDLDSAAIKVFFSALQRRIEYMRLQGVPPLA